MVGELNVLNEWIPEQMHPGTIFVLENAGHVGEKEDPYWAVLSCPDCGTLGLITRKQLAGLLPVICGSDQCSVQFFINDSDILIRKPSHVKSDWECKYSRSQIQDSRYSGRAEFSNSRVREGTASAVPNNSKNDSGFSRCGLPFPSRLAQRHLVHLVHGFPIPGRRADLEHLLQHVIA